MSNLQPFPSNMMDDFNLDPAEKVNLLEAPTRPRLKEHWSSQRCCFCPQATSNYELLSVSSTTSPLAKRYVSLAEHLQKRLDVSECFFALRRVQHRRVPLKQPIGIVLTQNLLLCALLNELKTSWVEQMSH